MKTYSEQSFGARLRKAQDLQSFFLTFDSYNPPRIEDKPAGFASLLNEIIATNATETTLRNTYNTEVTTRYNAFKKDSNSITKVITQIRNFVIAQYGKDSIQAAQTDNLVRKMRSSKLIKIADVNGQVEATVSTSEKSYGSTTQFFNNLITTLEGFTNYEPDNETIKIENLKLFSANISRLNNNVAINYKGLKTAKEKRRELYEKLNDSVLRIKAYIRSKFGSQSAEYKLVAKL